VQPQRLLQSGIVLGVICVGLSLPAALTRASGAPDTGSALVPAPLPPAGEHMRSAGSHVYLPLIAVGFTELTVMTPSPTSTPTGEANATASATPTRTSAPATTYTRTSTTVPPSTSTRTATRTQTSNPTPSPTPTRTHTNTNTTTPSVTRTPADTTPPDTTITSGPPDPQPNGDASYFFFVGTDNQSGIDRFECRLGSLPWQACWSPQFFTVGSGLHTFQIRAWDKAGNVDPTPASWTWYVLQAPGQTLTPTRTPSATATRTRTATATPTRTRTPTPGDFIPPETGILSGPDAQSANSCPIFTFTGTDNLGGSGLYGFECSLNSGGWYACLSPRQIQAGTLTTGANTFRVRAVDMAGNRDQSPATWSWQVVWFSVCLSPAPGLQP